MTPLPFDPDNPPDQPPPGVRQPLLWRLAIGLRRDHDLDRTSGGTPDRCRTCGATWPCLVRRTAERGLLAAFRDPPGPHRVRWFDPPDTSADPPDTRADPPDTRADPPGGDGGLPGVPTEPP